MIVVGDGALLIVGTFKRRVPDPDFKVRNNYTATNINNIETAAATIYCSSTFLCHLNSTAAENVLKFNLPVNHPPDYF